MSDYEILSNLAMSKMSLLMNWFEGMEDEFAPGEVEREICQIALLSDHHTPYPIEKFIDIRGLITHSNEFYDRYITQNSQDGRLLEKMGMTRTRNYLFDKLLTNIDDLSDKSYRNVLRTMYLAGALKYLKGNLMDVVGNSDLRNFVVDFIRFLITPCVQEAKKPLKNGTILVKKPMQARA